MDWLVRTQIIMELHGVGFCAVIGMLLLFSKQKIYRGGKILAAAIFVDMLLLVDDAVAHFSDGSTNMWGAFLVRFSNFNVFLLEYALIIIITLYVYVIIRTVNPNYPDTCKYIIWGIMAVNTVMLCMNIFMKIFYSIDAANVYHREKIFPVSMILAGLCLGVISFILCQNWQYLNTERYEIILFLVCPIIGAILQYFHYGYSFVIGGITVSVFLAFVIYVIRLRKWRAERELVLLQSQAYLLNSQIKPHFLFNSLNVIQSLIEEDPETAVMAVNRFSKFLRAGLKIDVMNSMVPLQIELDYVEDYLYLEKLRHGDKITVVRKIEEGVDFEIPFLTLQPIVENAVRHGICKRIKGGTVMIDIRTEGTEHVIRIIDDGVGYLPLLNEEKDWNPEDHASSGVGSVNVKKRLAMMCNGTLEVYSVLGKGTTVTIRIPGN